MSERSGSQRPKGRRTRRERSSVAGESDDTPSVRLRSPQPVKAKAEASGAPRAQRSERKPVRGAKAAASVSQWGDGYPLGPVMASKTLAVSVDAIYTITREGRTPKWQQALPLPSEERWLSLYKHPTKVQSLLLPLIVGESAESCGKEVSLFIRQFQRALYHLPRLAGAIDTTSSEYKLVAKQTESVVQSFLAGWQQELDADTDPAPSEYPIYMQCIESGALPFLFRVWIPSMVVYGILPHKLFHRARSGNPDSLNRLLCLDATVLGDPLIWQTFRKLSMQRHKAPYKNLVTSLKGKLPACGRKKIKMRFLALAHQFFTAFPRQPNSTSLRELFDLVAQRQSGNASLVDTDLSMSNEAIQKAVQRMRSFFDFLPHSGQK